MFDCFWSYHIRHHKMLITVHKIVRNSFSIKEIIKSLIKIWLIYILTEGFCWLWMTFLLTLIVFASCLLHVDRVLSRVFFFIIFIFHWKDLTQSRKILEASLSFLFNAVSKKCMLITELNSKAFTEAHFYFYDKFTRQVDYTWTEHKMFTLP